MSTSAAPQRSRREEYAEASRRALIESATRRFVEDGFAATSLDAVAADARMTKGAVYHHFTNKQALFEAVFEQLEARAMQDVVDAGATASSVWEACVAGLDRAFDQCMDRTYQRLCFEEGPIALGYARWHELGVRYELGLIREMLIALQSDCLVEVDDLDTLAQLLFGSLCSAALAIARADDPQATRDRMRDGVVRLVEGLRPR